MERTAVPRGKRPRVQVSINDKERAIARIRKGETKAGISRELGVPESTVRGWVKRADQRIAREAVEGNGNPTPSHTPMPALKLPTKRDHSGQPVQVQLPTVHAAAPASGLSSVPLPLSMQLFQQAADSQLQLTGWLHIFNAGILNFTLIATAAFLRARVRGLTDRQSLWQIICEYVDDAGRNVAANGGQYVLGTTTTATTTAATATTGMGSRQLTAFGHSRSSGGASGGGSGGGGAGGFMAPRLHITAEDDEDASMATVAGAGAGAGTGAASALELGTGPGLGSGL